MSTTSASSTTPSARPHDAHPDAGTALGDGRYRLGRVVSRHASGALWHADDTRLGRVVLIRCDEPAPTARTVRLAAIDHPAVAPVLDAGEALGADGMPRSWTVFPATDWLPFDALPAADLAAVDTAGLAAAAAWLVAATVHTRSVRGTAVALSSDAVVLDLRWLAGALPADGCPVRWMPAPGADDDLRGVVDRLGTAVRRRDRRRWTAAVAPLAVAHGRRRAVRLLAGLAGLDPHALGLTPLAPHHAERERRPFGRRSPVGTLPTTPRKELACESVEASS